MNLTCRRPPPGGLLLEIDNKVKGLTVIPNLCAGVSLDLSHERNGRQKLMKVRRIAMAQ